MRRAAGVPLLLFLGATLARAQGGPPLITDDPGTPGNGNWEINAAAQVLSSSASTVTQAPLLDLNYGYGDHVQLNLQTGYLTANTYGEGNASGLSIFSLGSKLRFVDEDRAGFAMSTYPRIDFHGPFSSTNERINTPGTRFFLPIELSKEFGRFGINPEVGYAHFTQQDDEWDFGIASSYEVAPERGLLAEVHARKVHGLGGTEVLPNLGARWSLLESASLIGAVGRSIAQTDDEPVFWSFYLGAQLRY